MATVYAVKKHVNEFYLDETEKKPMEQIGEPDPGHVIAISKTIGGALKCLESYFDEEMDLNALESDKIVNLKKLEFPKRRLDYRCFDDNGAIRHLVSLAIVRKNTILGDLLV